MDSTSSALLPTGTRDGGGSWKGEETCLAISVFANAISEVGVLNERQLKRRRDDDDGDVQQGTNQIRYQP